MRARALKFICVVLLLAGLPVAASAQSPQPQPAPSGPTGSSGATGTSGTTGDGSQSGGVSPDEPTPTVPGAVAQVKNGIAYAPADAPDAVKQVIWAANQIVGLPYRYGGGHTSDFEDSAYDCSGTVSFALHGGALLRRPRDSSSFYKFGKAGPGQWITIFTKSSHAYMTVAGLRLDTSAQDDPGGLSGPRWRPLRPSDAGYKVRHPTNL